ncbi:hypothetical protein F4780DRAFT_752198 [Xylariomycetidae sp. FL0641]|nr:hypothetical protein F4780DRAFT_752198 [Xylariomycetidae sp. FL0641]
MAPGPNQMSHEEVWDDSTLIDSWNEALDEYKRYHSIHRYGGNVDDLLGAKPDHETPSDAKDGTDAGTKPSDHGDLEADAERRGETVDHTSQKSGMPDAQHSHSLAAGPGPGPAPAGLLSSVRDEGLKRLLMSWYYAGYYTGYYEGQRDPSTQGEASNQR